MACNCTSYNDNCFIHQLMFFSKFYGKVGVISWLLFHLIWKITFRTEILICKVELWIFSLVSPEKKRHKTTFNCILNMQNLFLEFPVWTPYLNFWFPSSYPHISSRVEDSLLFLKYTWNNSRAVTSGGMVTRVSGTRSNIGNWKKSLLLCIYTKNLAKQLKNSLSISFCQIFAVHTYIFNDFS